MKPQIAIAALAIGVASIAVAHEGHEHATGIVRERMILMEQMGQSLLTISRQLRSNKEFEKINEEAKAIERLSREVASKFPPGSTQFPTAAKPIIWEQWSDFETKSAKLQTEARKLTQMSATDASALRTQFRAVAFACDGCHETYRATKY